MRLGSHNNFPDERMLLVINAQAPIVNWFNYLLGVFIYEMFVFLSWHKVSFRFVWVLGRGQPPTPPKLSY